MYLESASFLGRTLWPLRLSSTRKWHLWANIWVWLAKWSHYCVVKRAKGHQIIVLHWLALMIGPSCCIYTLFDLIVSWFSWSWVGRGEQLSQLWHSCTTIVSAFRIGKEGLLLKPCHNTKVQGWYIAPNMHQYLLATRKMQEVLSVWGKACPQALP